jgi:hypothetical protein
MTDGALLQTFDADDAPDEDEDCYLVPIGDKVLRINTSVNQEKLNAFCVRMVVGSMEEVPCTQQSDFCFFRALVTAPVCSEGLPQGVVRRAAEQAAAQFHMHAYAKPEHAWHTPAFVYGCTFAAGTVAAECAKACITHACDWT